MKITPVAHIPHIKMRSSKKPFVDRWNRSTADPIRDQSDVKADTYKLREHEHPYWNNGSNED